MMVKVGMVDHEDVGAGDEAEDDGDDPLDN